MSRCQENFDHFSPHYFVRKKVVDDENRRRKLEKESERGVGQNQVIIE